jgi:hypothetical protein
MTVREEDASKQQDANVSLLADESKRTFEVYRQAVMRRKHFYPHPVLLASAGRSLTFAIGLCLLADENAFGATQKTRLVPPMFLRPSSYKKASDG